MNACIPLTTEAASALLVATFAVPVVAQDLGDAARGKAYAERNCAECHAIGAGETSSPRPGATPFANVAARPEMTGTALAVWFRTPHPSMPNLIIPGEDKDNVIAYILSLAPKK